MEREDDITRSTVKDWVEEAKEEEWYSYIMFSRVNYAGEWKQAKKGGLEDEGAEGKSGRGRMEASKFEGNMGIMT